MGRPEFENQMSIAATTSKRVKYIEQSSVASLAPNTYERLTIFSPVNTVSKIMNLLLGFDAIPGQTTGVRRIIIDTYISESRGLGNVSGEVNGEYANNLRYGTGRFYTGANNTAAVVTAPSSETAVSSMIRDIRYDEVIGISFVFYHTAAAATTAERKFWLFIEEETVKR